MKKKSSKRSILVIGRSTVDVAVPNLSTIEINKQEPLGGYSMMPGGSGLNIVVSLVYLDADVSFCSKIGNDFPAMAISQTLSNLKLSNLYISHTDSALTSFSLINVNSDGELGLHQHSGANDLLSLDDIPSSAVEANNIIHIAGAYSMRKLDGEPTAQLLKKARKLGKITSLSTSRNTQAKKTLYPILPFLDFLFINEKEALETTGAATKLEAAAWFQSRGVREIIITLGKKGVFIFTNDTSMHFPAIKIMPIDTTGCGDSFVAGYLDAFARDLPMQQRAMQATALAAHCARCTSALPAPFTPIEITALNDLKAEMGTVTALILAGGKSTRMHGTKQKLTMKLHDKPLILWIIDCLRQAGIHRIIILSGHAGESIHACLRNQPVEFINLGDSMQGTGHAIKEALRIVTNLPDTIMILNGDTPLIKPESIRKLLDRYNAAKVDVVAGTATSPNLSKYSHGAVIRDNDNKLLRIKHCSEFNQSDIKHEVNVGTYVFNRKTLLAGASSLTPASQDGQMHFSDILTQLKNTHSTIELVYFDDFLEFMSVNTQELLEEAGTLLSKRQYNIQE